MAWAFHHHLHTFVPCALGQLSEGYKLVYLCPVGCIRYRAGPESVAQGKDQFILPRDIEEPVVLFIQWIFFPVLRHPGSRHGATPGYYVHQPPFVIKPFNRGSGNTAVDSDEVNSVFRVLFNGFKQVIRSHVDEGLPFLVQLYNSGVDWDRPYGHRRLLYYLLPYIVKRAAGREVHHCICPCLNSYSELFKLNREVGAVAGSPNIGIYLCPQTLSYGKGLYIMPFVPANGDIPFSNAISNEICRHPL